MADKSLITDLLKTPSQIRKEREERLLTEGLAQAQLFNQGNRLGGVGGMFAGFGASQAAQTGRDIDRAVTGVRSAASAATGKDFRRGEERVAAADQAIMKGVKTNDPDSLRKAAEKVSNPRAREAMLAKADQLDATRAATARTKEVEDRDYTLAQNKDMREAGMSQAQISEINARVKKIQSETANVDLDVAYNQATQEARIAQTRAESMSAQANALVSQATTQDQIAQSRATLENTLANTNQTNASTQQTLQNIDQATQMFGVELSTKLAALDQTKLQTEISKFELDKGRAMLPHEIEELTRRNDLISEQTRTEISTQLKNQSATDRNNQAIDEFTRMLDLSNLSEAEKVELTKQRAIAMAAGGDQSFDPNEAANKARVEALTSYVSEYQDAKSTSAMYDAMLNSAQFANLGPTSSIKDIATGVGAFFGLDQGTKAANQLIDVFTKGLTLKNAKLLTGAISEKELKFLTEMIPGRATQPEFFFTNFASKQAEANARVNTIKLVESEMMAGNLKDAKLNRTSISDIESVYKFIDYYDMTSKYKPLQKQDGVAGATLNSMLQEMKTARERLGDNMPPELEQQLKIRMGVK